jgi:ribonuclease HI
MTINNTTECSLVLAIDSACPNTGGHSCFAFVQRVTLDDEIMYRTAWARRGPVVSNKLEADLLGAISALTYAIEGRWSEVTILTSSQVLQLGIAERIGGWKRNGWVNASLKSVQHRELWLKLEALTEQLSVTWEWTQARSNPFQMSASAVARDMLAGRLRNLPDLMRRYPDLFSE